MWLGRLRGLHRVHCSSGADTNFGRVRALLCYQTAALGGAMWLGRLRWLHGVRRRCPASRSQSHTSTNIGRVRTSLRQKV